MKQRFLLLTAIVLFSSAVAAVSLAHPGHQYRVTGIVSKIRVQQLRLEQFDVTEPHGTKTTFFANPATEVLVGKARGTDADIRVGVAATVEGVENDRGMIEAKVVRIMAPKQ
jgi:hypothetical protein